MDLFEKIDQHSELYGLTVSECRENNSNLMLGCCLLSRGEINDDLIRILKIDKYYSSCFMHSPPPSVDCLIIVKNGGSYSYFMVELRDVKGAALVKPRDIMKKFETTVNDFINSRFRDVFVDGIVLRAFQMILVTNPYKASGVKKESYNKKIKGTVLEQYNLLPPLRVGSKRAIIKPLLPGCVLCLYKGVVENLFD